MRLVLAVRLALAAPLLAAPAAGAEEPALRFALPVLCELGVECFVQQYVDADPGPGAEDHLCGELSYDGHDGTDFAIATLADMERGIPVVAAARGTVRAVRDGEPDLYLSERGPEAVKGRESGNGVLIDHPGGWASQYAHLKQGSVLVQPGQPVSAGQILGLIGLSGATEFPHLEFRVFHKGRRLDPFTGLEPGSGCGERGRGLWDSAATQALVYRAGGLMAAGFADRAPDPRKIAAGTFLGNETLPAEAEALAFWAMDYGLSAGDSWRLEILGPDGSILAETDGRLEEDQAQWIGFVGRRRDEPAWPAGRYQARHRVMRNGILLIDETRMLTVQ